MVADGTCEPLIEGEEAISVSLEVLISFRRL